MRGRSTITRAISSRIAFLRHGVKGTNTTSPRDQDQRDALASNKGGPFRCEDTAFSAAVRKKSRLTEKIPLPHDRTGFSQARRLSGVTHTLRKARQSIFG